MPVPPVDRKEAPADPATASPQTEQASDGAPLDTAENTETLPPPPVETKQQAYRLMLLMRRFEEKAGQLYGMGYVGGFCHLYIGQEAIAAAIASARAPQDRIITAYRNHAHLLAAGADPRAVMSELTGRRDGIAGGRAGSAQMFWPEGGFYGGHAIVGTNAALGIGLAFADQYQGNDAVTWCILGDAAMNQGQVAESLHLAASWDLPVVFVIENNTGRSGQSGTDATPLSERGKPYGIPGRQVDGMDFRANLHAFADARQAVREGAGPQLIECLTEQYRGHSMSDPGKYRSSQRADPAQQRAADPITKMRDRLMMAGVSEEVLREIDRDVRQIVNEAAAHAQSAGSPASEDLTRNVLGEHALVLTQGPAGTGLLENVAVEK